jgi:hypothetical protein
MPKTDQLEKPESDQLENLDKHQKKAFEMLQSAKESLLSAIRQFLENITPDQVSWAFTLIERKCQIYFFICSEEKAGENPKESTPKRQLCVLVQDVSHFSDLGEGDDNSKNVALTQTKSLLSDPKAISFQLGGYLGEHDPYCLEVKDEAGKVICRIGISKEDDILSQIGADKETVQKIEIADQMIEEVREARRLIGEIAAFDSKLDLCKDNLAVLEKEAGEIGKS